MAEESGHILVVDDNRTNRLKLSRGLEQQGHVVASAESGRQALQMLQEQPFDVVLLDIVMPELDGYAVLSQMKSDVRLRDIPVIVISAVDELDSAVRCIEMGAEDYLPKPFNPVFLKARLDASLRRKRLRDLEQAYLRQELMLRQSEKLATLGRLAAGMAHELNNPASATQRGIEQVRSAFERNVRAQLALGGPSLTPAQAATLPALLQVMQSGGDQAHALDALTRSDRESALERWLAEAGIDRGWELAPALLKMGYDADQLARLSAAFTAEQAAHCLTWLVTGFTVFDVYREISDATRRISEIVQALKTYTYLDQAPVQDVDVHEALENTLAVFRSRLKEGVTIHRQYAEGLPSIEAYGSELNQVWTNIIENALYAMDSQGEITLSTRLEGNWVVVEITDNGPGIPEAIRSRIFDPFFTTKPPGEGAGLGLSISHNIVVERHKGEITVASQPGRTCMSVKLPVRSKSA